MEREVSHDWEGLRQICARLRAPGGCEWDRAQTLQSLTPYLLEETHELLDAISAGDDSAVAEEIGDVLYLLISLLEIGEEERRFTLATVARRTAEKLVRRHPHVFGPVEDRPAPRERIWESVKRTERPGGSPLPLASGSERLPALLEAFRVQEKAAGLGFDWPGPEGVLSKLEEERQELGRAMEQADGERRRAEVRDEIGDLLFTLVNLSRHLGHDPEQALRVTVRKFSARFARMEELLRREGRTLAQADLAAMEDAWQRSKAGE
jgi:MazG family protein